MNYRPIPHSVITGNVWPALPCGKGQTALALLYQMEQTQWWSEADLRQMQFKQLSSLLEHSWKTIPYYGQKLESVGIEPPFSNLGKYWTDLPILLRSDIQQVGDDLISSAVPKDHGRISDIHTSGSTGAPIRACRTELALRFWSAFTLRDHLWHKRDFRGKLAVVRNSGKGQDPYPKGSRYKYWGSSRRAFNTGPSVSLNINCSAEQQMEWLQKENPDYLLTHPTNLARLLQYSLENDIRLSNMKQVQTLSEILRDEVRDICREVWGVPISDMYSGREVGYASLQCPEHDHQHVMSEGVLVEVIDDQGNACKTGEVGRVLITTLHNFAMPFIRYDVGDFAEVGEPCPCGRGLPVLKRILGREQNMLALPGGVKRWTLLSEGNIRKFLKIAPIREFQFIQKDLENMEVRLVVAREVTNEEETEIRNWLLEKFAHPFNFKIDYLDQIPRSKAGKLQDFISEVK